MELLLVRHGATVAGPSVCVCVRAHVCVYVLDTSPTGFPESSQAMPTQATPLLGPCHTEQVPMAGPELMAKPGVSSCQVILW